MGIIDVVVLVIIGIVAFKGFMKGLVMEIFGMIALMFGFLASFQYSSVFGSQLAVFGMSEKTNQALGYVAAFLVSYGVVMFLGTLLSRLFKEVKLGWLNQGVGALFGGMKAAAILSVFLSFMLTTLAPDSSVRASMKDGSVSRKLADFAPSVYNLMNRASTVKRNNPFELPSAEEVQQAIEDANMEAVKQSAEAVKNTAKAAVKDAAKAKAEETVKQAPAKKKSILEEEFQKN
ncbi:CvpA family protein [Seleniivibrio woodruffii]|uniref:Membrane protein required for colicin V production n=1 Tax=Seleniivibrio woodruffii TaxID=1078050 RepID=A0A4V2PS17_9BACT|nr:CvpA family protein [Seleniivibrio woodruffii]TCK60971.1 membrane protein required for colicin V production [Seleniivibrio woodruffii]TVZ36601.1 membrane protein required for colicin V production [Seleniivibrio woodruffii]